LTFYAHARAENRGCPGERRCAPAFTPSRRPEGAGEEGEYAGFLKGNSIKKQFGDNQLFCYAVFCRWLAS